MTQTTDLKAIADALRQHDRFLVVTHENPDGDALGSLLAATLALRQLGKDAVMYLAGQTPLPARVRVHAARDARPRTRRPTRPTVCCSRSTVRRRTGSATRPLSRWPRSSSTSITTTTTPASATSTSSSPTRPRPGKCCATCSPSSDVELTPELAEPLYIALVTDTGRFQYANTTPKALRLAAELVDAGADIHAVFQQVYESVEFAKLKLLARALDRAEVLEGGRIVVSHLLRTDFAEVGASEPYSEGLIDYLRAVEGAELAVLIREQLSHGAPAHKGSLRSSIDELDVSAIARRFGGGGHRQAAGFSTDLPLEEIVEQIREGFLEQRATSRA